MGTIQESKQVEARNLIAVTTENVLIPKTQSDVFRGMKVGDKVETPADKRQSMYINASRAFRAAQFSTRKIDGKVYLIRTA